MILQIEGETWVRGMDLYEFADFAAELGMYSAINLGKCIYFEYFISIYIHMNFFIY